MTHSWPLNLAPSSEVWSPEVANLVEEGTAEMAKLVDKDENVKLSWIAMESLDSSWRGGQRGPCNQRATKRREAAE